MSPARRGALVLVVAALVALAAPASASAHAYLVKTVADAAARSSTRRPRTVALTYDEAVEPRFAIISVTNARGQQETTAPVHRSPSNPDTLVVPLKPHLPRAGT